MEDKELKKRLDKIPDADENGEPIFKIAIGGDRDEKPEMPKIPEKDD